MHTYLRRYLSVAAAALGVVGLVPIAGAQPAAPGQLEEIIVSAERVETSLQKTPISVTAFGAEQLREQGASNLLEMSAFVPNLVVGTQPGGAFARGGYAIRGIGQDGQPQAAVGVYVDDVYANQNNILGIFDVQRVEVLRGPQGTLFGRNTIGGAIQYVTAKPTFGDIGGSVAAVAGNYDRQDLEGVLNVPFGDIVAARFAFATQQHGGYVHDNLNDVERGQNIQKFGRVQVRVHPSDRLTIDAKLEEVRQNNNGRASTMFGFDNTAQFVQLAGFSNGGQQYSNAVLSTGRYEVFGYNFPDYAKSDSEVAQVVVEYDASDRFTFKSITAQTSSESAASTDFDLSNLSILGFASTTQDDVLSQEFRFAGRTKSERFSWTTGIYYFDDKPGRGTSLLQLGLMSIPGSSTPPEDKQTAIYGQVGYAFTDRLEGTLGVRHTEEDTIVGDPSGTYKDTSPQVGLNFQATKDVLLYGKMSKGFRAGGLSVGMSGTTSRRFGPEKAWTTEFGARMEFANHRVRVNPTIFHTSWDDLQFRLLVPGSATVDVLTQNAGKADISGLELETQFLVSDRLQFNASLSSLDSHYVDVDNNVLGQIYGVPFFFGALVVPNICDGKNDPAVTATNPALLTPQNIAKYSCNGRRSEMQRAPKLKVALGMRHEAPLSNGASLTTSVDYSHTDRMRSNITELDFENLPAWGQLNARVQFNAPKDRWNIALFGTNLTNQYYLIGASNFFTTTGTVHVLDPGRPREFGVSFRANF